LKRGEQAETAAVAVVVWQVFQVELDHTVEKLLKLLQAQHLHYVQERQVAVDQ
jgi:hypothetical protein